MDCLFCSIAAKQIPAKIVLETDTVLVFHDITPKAKVHVLVIPKLHIVTFNDVTAENKSAIADMGLAVGEATKLLGIAHSGYKVMVNNGHNGGQEVPHLHWHVLGGERVKGIV